MTPTFDQLAPAYRGTPGQIVESAAPLNDWNGDWSWPPRRSGNTRRPSLEDLQRELDTLRAFFETHTGARVQDGRELAQALRLGIPHLEALLPRYVDHIKRAADALEELAA